MLRRRIIRRCYRQPLPIALPMLLVPGRVATGQAVLSAAPCERQSGRMLAIHPTSAPGLGAPLSRSLGDLLCTQFVNSLDNSIATLLRRVDRVRLVGCGTSGRALRPRSPSPPGGRMPGFPLDFERLTAACRQAVRCVCVRDSAPRAPSSLFHVLNSWLRFSLVYSRAYKPLHSVECAAQHALRCAERWPFAAQHDAMCSVLCDDATGM